MSNSFEFQKIIIANKTNKQIYFEIMNQLLNYSTCRDEYRKDISKVVKFLKFKNQKEIEILDFSICQLQDTEDAFLEYFKNGLSKKNLGEFYLRLYGILNATSLHYEALIELNKLFNCGFNIIEARKNSKIYQLRNKLGSHSLNYLNDAGNNIYTSRFSMALTFSFGESMMLTSGENEIENINLYEEMIKFSIETENFIKNLCLNFISKINAEKMKFYPILKEGLNSIDYNFDYESLKTIAGRHL